MIKTLKALAIAGTLGVLASLAVAPTSAAAATVDVNAQLKQRPQIVHHNGSATVVFWLRCRAGMNAFEYHVGLTQDGVFHGFDAGPAAFILTVRRHPAQSEGHARNRAAPRPRRNHA